MGHKRGEICLLCDPEVEPKGRKEFFKGVLGEADSDKIEFLLKELIKVFSSQPPFYHFDREYIIPLQSWEIDRKYFHC